MQSNLTTIHKLQTAINMKFHQRILINRSQFYSEEQDRPITAYIVQKVVPNTDPTSRKKFCYIELFRSMSQIQILLFMRDLWYELNGWEIPTDNEQWNNAKAEYYNSLKEDKQDGKENIYTKEEN